MANRSTAPADTVDTGDFPLLGGNCHHVHASGDVDDAGAVADRNCTPALAAQMHQTSFCRLMVSELVAGRVETVLRTNIPW